MVVWENFSFYWHSSMAVGGGSQALGSGAGGSGGVRWGGVRPGLDEGEVSRSREATSLLVLLQQLLQNLHV